MEKKEEYRKKEGWGREERTVGRSKRWKRSLVHCRDEAGWMSHLPHLRGLCELTCTEEGRGEGGCCSRCWAVAPQGHPCHPG